MTATTPRPSSAVLTLIASFIPPRPAWADDAACIEHPTVNFHPGRGESTAPARAVCATCLVRPECLTYALEEGMDDGVWGGTTGKDRRAIKATTRSNERGTSATP